MKNFIKFASGLIILSFCIILFSIILGTNKKQYVVKNGALDLTNISSKKSAVPLNGQWEFYWGELVSSNGKLQSLKDGQFVKVPAIWTKYKDKANKSLPVEGYGTYRIVIKASKGDNLALKLPQIGSSYNLWIDGKIRYSSGKVGTNATQSKPKWTTKVADFTVENNYTELMLEVSNFHYFRGGISTPILIGTEDQIQQLKYRGLFLDTFIFSALFVMAIFFFIIYIMHTQNKSYIYLAVFLIVIALRPLLYGECYFNNIFPNINFEVNSKIYLVNFIAIQLFFLYFYYQYENLMQSKIVHIIGATLIVTIFVGVILPAKYMIYPVVVLEVMIPIVVVICIYLFYLAYLNKYEDIGINVLSVLLIFFLAVVDVLNNNGVIELNIYYTPIAMLIVSFIQAFLQICKFRESTRLNEKLAYDMEINNLKLGYERRQRSITEKLNNGLKSMVSTLEIEELLTNITENLFQIIDFNSVSIVFKIDENINIVAIKIKDKGIRCFKYKGNINFEQSKIKKLQSIEKNIEKNLIIKPLYYKEELLCSVRIVTNYIDKDIMQLIDIYCEQSILALQNAKSYKKIKEMAMYDELTKIYNRRYLMKLGNEEFYKSNDLTVVMFDIDHFKNINDTYGHLFGDKVIKNIARICKKNMPSNSIVGRYGGEEFIVIINSIDLKGALSLAEELRREVESYSYSYEAYDYIRATISIGVSKKHNRHKSLHNLINSADEALYKAKSSGRNCIELDNFL